MEKEKLHQILHFLRKKRIKEGINDLLPLYYKVTKNDLPVCEESLYIYLDYISLLKLKDSYEEIDNIFKYKLKTYYYKNILFWKEYLEFLKNEEKILKEKEFLERKVFDDKETVISLIKESILALKEGNIKEKI